MNININIALLSNIVNNIIAEQQQTIQILKETLKNTLYGDFTDLITIKSLKKTYYTLPLN